MLNQTISYNLGKKGIFDFADVYSLVVIPFLCKAKLFRKNKSAFG